MAKKFWIYGFLLALMIPRTLSAQVVFWTENFNNGCTSNCSAAGYAGSNGSWTVATPGTNGNVANEFFISCAENGEPVGSCGAGCGSNATLHVGSVPCGLCFVCPNGDCGASYNAGPAFGGEDPLTDIRAESPVISTLGKSGITLTFKYIERGQGASDDASVEYSINGGAAWLPLTATAKTANTCGGGQGLWTSFSFALPVSCENIPDLKIGFRWVNNSDGTGNDPSFAVDDVELNSTASVAPVADFSTPLTAFCDSTCIGFTDLSQNSPSSWSWIFPGATPPTFSGLSPVNICYNVPGTYDVTLIVSNTAGSDTIVKTGYITVNSCFLPEALFTASDTFFCEKNCIDFTDLSTNNPSSWQWFFQGGDPDTSSLQNPTGICYDTYGTYNVQLIATNVIGSDTTVYNTYITVNQSPAAPVATLSGGNILTSTAASSYQWYFNSAPIIGAVNQVHIAQAAGDYFVIITDSNGCQAASNIVNVTFAGIGSITGIGTVDIYPNPANSVIYIEVNSVSDNDIHFSVVDISGRIVLNEDIAIMPGHKIYHTDISHLESGTYFINVHNSSGRFINKLIKN